ncbi:uncharacterized protein PG986_003972 [Apiospora aurea]|uniref:Peptidase S9 prolyl oligopeptidase catalytic domain-containing protein n=1 Tax=Apiospora aurea TaxID=335848 RepID=A0ABR1QL97_9PEZI
MAPDNAETTKTEAPYGQWESEITKEALFRGSRNLVAPRVCAQTGRTLFTESRPDGSYYLVEAYQGDKGYECRTVLPAGYSARSRVYEYGGGAYAILSSSDNKGEDGPRIIFSNFSDCSVQVLDVDTQKVTCLLEKSDTMRYADFAAHPRPGSPWVLAVQEDHASAPKPDQVRNYVVAIHTGTGEVRRAVEGADFYMYPSFSPDGKKVAWVQWNFPDMPWSGVKVYWADWDDEAGDVSNVEWVAGEDDMTVTEPRWGSDGFLYFCYEKTNYRQFYRRRPGGDSALLDFKGYEEAEFGSASMFIGSHTYSILSEECVVAVATENGTDRVIAFNPETLQSQDLSLPLSEITYDGLYRLSDTSFIVIGSSATAPQALYRVDITTDDASNNAKVTKIWWSNDEVFKPEIFSTPQYIRFPATSGPKRDIHGCYWPPHNLKYQGPAGTKPPLIVQSHGGPTGHTGPGLNLSMQYWNARGYATFAINYSGSDGHGKTYRELLNGRWGAIDVDDIAESVRHLSSSASTSLIDGRRVGIRGGSAGGYSVLQALCHHPALFAGGACYYGISDVKLLLQETHKMESHYVDFLLFTPTMTEADKEQVMRDRSPVHHAGNITAPLLICHGEEDKVVPISQAYTMYDDIHAGGGEVRLVKFPGEGHGFRKGENLLRALEEEEAWWKKTIARVE